MTTSVDQMTSRPRFRTIALTSALLALGTTSLAACGSSDGPYSINGTSGNASDVKTLSKALIEDEVVQPDNNDITATDLRTLITWMIQNEAATQFFAKYDLSITDADKQATIAADQQNFASLSDVSSEFFATHQSVRTVWSKIKTPDEATAQALYENAPALSGSLCLSHILVKTEKEAKDIVAEIKDGKKFADLAKSKSIDTGSGANGGALQSSETNVCIPNSTLMQNYDNQFTNGALTAKIGSPSDPVKSQFGWHIILNRPWSEVKDSVMENLATEPGREMFIGFLSTSKVSVNSKYGKWDPATVSVVAKNSSTTSTTTADAPTDTVAGQS